MFKFILILLSLTSALFAYTAVSDANQDLMNSIISYSKDGTIYLDELFVTLQTKLFQNAYLGVLFLIPFIFFVHYLIIGPKVFSHDGKKIYLFTLFNRIIHAISALSFMVLISTGLIMMFGSFFGGGSFVIICKELHAISTILFAISIVPMFIMWFKNMLFDSDDIKWIMILGGYLSKVKKPIPAGKFNAGQKMWFWVCTLGGLLMIVTGAILYFHEINVYLLSLLGLTQIQMLRLSVILHNFIGLAVTALFFTHIYMSMIAIKGAIYSIINGYKEEEEVKILHSTFYKKLINRK